MSETCLTIYLFILEMVDDMFQVLAAVSNPPYVNIMLDTEILRSTTVACDLLYNSERKYTNFVHSILALALL